MSKLHHTVSRRDFMKGLGLAGAGVGAAAAATPVLHDLDELTSSPAHAKVKHPWWVKDLDYKKYTVEIDWNMMVRFDQTKHMFNRNSFKAQVGEEEYNRLNQLESANVKKWIAEARPGWDLRDSALKSASGFRVGFYGLKGYFVAPKMAARPEAYGASRWQGTPEENVRTLRAAIRFYGGRDLGVVELDQDTSKLIYSHDADGKPYFFENVPKGYETDEKRVIPNSKQMYLVSWNSQESTEMMKEADTARGEATVDLSYSDGILEFLRLQQFIEGLGWEALSEYTHNSLAHSTACGVAAGLAEMSRMSITNLSPEFGSHTRTWKLVTDFPLAPTKPIDAGLFMFCKTCKICADYCPGGAISTETEPFWEIRGPFNKPGCKNYYYHGANCLSWWRAGGVACRICNGVCPFGGKGKAMIHDLVKAAVATTPIFNGFFTNMEKTFDFDYRFKGFHFDNEEKHSWWDLDLPEKGWDSSRNTRHY